MPLDPSNLIQRVSITITENPIWSFIFAWNEFSWTLYKAKTSHPGNWLALRVWEQLSGKNHLPWGIIAVHFQSSNQARAVETCFLRVRTKENYLWACAYLLGFIAVLHGKILQMQKPQFWQKWKNITNFRHEEQREVWYWQKYDKIGFPFGDPVEKFPNHSIRKGPLD